VGEKAIATRWVIQSASQRRFITESITCRKRRVTICRMRHSAWFALLLFVTSPSLNPVASCRGVGESAESSCPP